MWTFNKLRYQKASNEKNAKLFLFFWHKRQWKRKSLDKKGICILCYSNLSRYQENNLNWLSLSWLIVRTWWVPLAMWGASRHRLVRLESRFWARPRLIWSRGSRQEPLGKMNLMDRWWGWSSQSELDWVNWME